MNPGLLVGEADALLSRAASRLSEALEALANLLPRADDATRGDLEKLGEWLGELSGLVASARARLRRIPRVGGGGRARGMERSQ